MISIVDDEKGVRKALGRLLHSAGFKVKAFASGHDFLKLDHEEPCDCAIVDLHLPDLSGLQVYEQLEREHRDVPVILITGREEPGLPERLQALGITFFLKKPIDENELLRTIEAATKQDQISDSQNVSRAPEENLSPMI